MHATRDAAAAFTGHETIRGLVAVREARQCRNVKKIEGTRHRSVSRNSGSRRPSRSCSQPSHGCHATNLSSTLDRALAFPHALILRARYAHSHLRHADWSCYHIFRARFGERTFELVASSEYVRLGFARKGASSRLHGAKTRPVQRREFPPQANRGKRMRTCMSRRLRRGLPDLPKFRASPLRLILRDAP